jgi:hypothetical protein
VRVVAFIVLSESDKQTALTTVDGAGFSGKMLKILGILASGILAIALSLIRCRN